MPRRVRVYMAGAYADRPRLRTMRAKLEELGFIVTSRWLNNVDEYGLAITEATNDVSDIDRSNFVVVDTFGPSRGGRDFECGYAYGIGKRVIRVGPIVNPFNNLAKLSFDNWDSLFAHLATSLEHADARNN